jgi:3-carboxy-cis,cis-muconate cycloisomerase
MALAEHTGRGAAHDLVYGACRAALDKGSTLLEELKRRPEVTKHLGGKRLAELTDPVNYLGSAPAMVDRALASRNAVGGKPGANSRKPRAGKA